RELIHRNERTSKIHVRPRRGLRLEAIQLDGTVKVLDGFVGLTKVVIAKPQAVVSAHHRWIQSNDLLQSGNGHCVVVRIVIKAGEPVKVQRILRLRGHKLLQLRPRPVAPAEPSVSDCQREPAADIEWSYSFCLLSTDRGRSLLVC